MFFGAIFWSFGIVTFHFEAFRGGEMRKVPDKVNQLPAILSAAMISSIGGECGHAGKTHAVFDYPEEFAVGEVLRLRQAQVGRFGVEAIADLAVAAAVVGVTDGAVIGEMKPGFAKIFRRFKHRILSKPRI